MPNSELVAINEQNNGKMLGGITGKGFMPGQSGNPSGRPKKHLTEAMRRKLDNDPERAERIAEQMLTQAEHGDVQSFDRVRDSIEGKPAQSVNINGDIDFSITDRRSRITEAISSLRDPEQ
jgi:hypothetical protein